jgi:hypothetical protein
MDRNARLLKLPGLESRTWLLCQVAVPGVSLTMGGRALGRLQKAISYAVDNDRAWRDPVRRLRVTWTATGLVWTAAFLAAWELGARGWLVTAMLISVVQCVAACVRGAQRLRVIREIGSRLDARVRPWLTAERAV